MNSMIRALVKTGVAISTRTDVTRTVQTMIGIRNRVMPGRPHLEDRHEEVDRAEDRARPDEDEGHDPQVLAVADAASGRSSVSGA